MSNDKRFSLLIVIISTLITVISTQIDYDYDRYEYNPYDYPGYYRSPNHRSPYHRRYSLSNYASNDDPKARGIVDKFKGLLIGTKCILTCLYKFSKNCGGLIECGWNCMAPNEPLPEPDKTQEEAWDDPKYEPLDRTANGGDGGVLPPDDIVRVAACSVQCLSKYLPRSKASLQRFMTCIVIRCFCDKQVNRSSKTG